MRTFITVLLFTTVFLAQSDDNIRIVRHGTNVTERPSSALATNIINYLQSCSINSTAYAIKAKTWQDLEHSDSYVLLTFAPPRKLVVMLLPHDDFPRYWEEKSIDQILVPLPEARLLSHVLAKSGTNVFSFTKMDPYPLKLIAQEPAVQLSSTQPYASLANIRPPKWWPTNGVWTPPTKKPE